MSQYRMPETTNNLNENLHAEEEDLIKINTYAIKRTLIFIAFIDLFIQLLNGFSLVTAQDNDNSNSTNSSNDVNDLHIYGYVSFGCAALILIGIYGINRYKKFISYGYGVYLSLNIISRLFLIFLFRLSFLTFIFSILVLFVNIWILKLLCKFTGNIKKLSQDNLHELRNGWAPTVVYTTVLY